MSKYEHKTTQNGHQDSIVLHRSSQKAKWHLQSWLGKWKLTEKLSWQNYSILYHWMMTLTTQNGHQDSNVLHSSIQGAEGHVCSWLGEWILTEELSWHKLLLIMSLDDLITKNGHQDSNAVNCPPQIQSENRGTCAFLMMLDDGKT